jgi:hypothetical protein
MENYLETNKSRKSRPSVGRIITRPESDYEDLPRAASGALRYSFIGLSAGAGTTSLAFSFAEYLVQTTRVRANIKKAGTAKQNRITVLEIGDNDAERRGFDYDRIGCDRRFAGRDFASCYGLTAAGRSIRGVKNLDSGINWLLRVPDEAPAALDAQDYMRMIVGAPGDVILCDISGTFGDRLFGAGPLGSASRTEFLRRILIDSDKVFVVIDPLPSAMMADPSSLELFKELETSGTNVTYIINKMNPGVNKRELRAFLRLRNATYIPHLGPVPVYTAEYNCCTFFALPAATAHLKSPFEQMNTI